jgi:hypothetical protein
VDFCLFACIVKRFVIVRVIGKRWKPISGITQKLNSLIVFAPNAKRNFYLGNLNEDDE